MITLGRMTVENFLSVGKRIEIDLSSFKGVNYIFGTNKDVDGGRNGVGKSAIFADSLLFVLFGETSRKVGNKYVAHRQMPDKETLITLELRSGDEDYHVEAGVKRGNGFFRLFKGDAKGESLAKGSIKETRRFFEQTVLGFGYDVAKSSFFLTSSDSSSFLMMKKEQKRSYIETIFKLGVFGDMLKRARVDLNNLDREISMAQSSARQIDESLVDFKAKDEGFRSELEAKLSSYDEKIRLLSASRPTAETKIAGLREYRSSLRIEPVDEGCLASYEAAVAAVGGSKSKLTGELAVLEESLSKLGAEEVESTVPDVPDAIDYSSAVEKLEEAKSAITSAKSKAEHAVMAHEASLLKCGPVLDAVCDKCKPVVSGMYNVSDEAVIAGHRATIAGCEAKLSAVAAKMAAVRAAQKAESDARRVKEREAGEARRRMVERDAAIRSLSKSIDCKRAELSACDLSLNRALAAKADAVVVEERKRKIAYEDAVRSVDRQIEAAERTLKDMDSAMERLAAEKAEAASSASPFKTLIEEYSVKKAGKAAELDGYSRKRKLLDVVCAVVGEDGVKKHILNDIVDIINNRVQKYLYMTGASFTCVFDGSFSCEFVTETGPASYENFSMGEKARINLAILLTFRDILLTMGFPRLNVLVMDELLDSGLDAYAVNAVVCELRRVASSEGLAGFLISHRECFDYEMFDKVIEVVKQGGYSELIIDSQREK